jgi:Protein of unknown function (DUF3987)
MSSEAAHPPKPHLELIVAQREIALVALGDKLRALEAAALRIAPIVERGEILKADAVDALYRVAENNSLCVTARQREDVEHIIAEGLAGRSAGVGYVPPPQARRRRDCSERGAACANDASPGHKWPAIASDAFHGLAGRVVGAIKPHTEADPIAILLQYLVAFGNVVGREPYYQVEGDKHFTNLFAVLVGETSKARKGTSAGRIRQLFEYADEKWAHEQNHSGMSSGEGLIWNVRDPTKQSVKDGARPDATRAEKEIDPGVSDKRLMIFEPEFAGALRVMQRDGNILSRIVRDAWDRGDLASLTKNSPARATGAHISIVGHITGDELRQSLDRVSMANGYANRFLFACVRRARFLPHGGNLSDETIRELGVETQAAITSARNIRRVGMTAEARDNWERIYAALSEGHPGLLGAIVGRAEAQTIRLALLYALLDGKNEIGAEHLRAAVALWEYCETSANHIFGDMLGNPVADEILRALRRGGETGTTRTQIRDLFGRHRSSNQIDVALAALSAAGKARSVTRNDTGGRAAEVWVAIFKE